MSRYVRSAVKAKSDGRRPSTLETGGNVNGNGEVDGRVRAELRRRS